MSRICAEASAPQGDRQHVLASAFDHAPVGMAVLTPTGSLTVCNPAMGALLGRDCADLVGTTFVEVAHPDDRAEAWRACEALQRGEVRTVHDEWRVVRRDGAVVWTSVDAACLPSVAGKRPWLVVHVADVTERKAREATLTHRALHDPLTGLPNRALLVERIERAHTHRGRHARPNCLFYLDLDGFKAVNDRFGHATGDRVLQLLADRLGALLRPEDTAARLGGDEFAVLCVDVEPQHCVRVAERLRAAAAAPFAVEGRSITISAAVGIVTARAFGPAAQNALDLLQQADRRMYEQKRSTVDRGPEPEPPTAAVPPDRPGL